MSSNVFVDGVEVSEEEVESWKDDSKWNRLPK
jgi:hypothetical protein